MSQKQLVPNITSPETNPSPDYTKQAWSIIWAWGLFLALCLLIRGGKLLVPLFPVGSVAVGLFLYLRAPVLYIGYTWWITFVGALIRRMIDFQVGYVTFGRWGITATLVTLISAITLIRYLPKAPRIGGLPFIISLIGVSYAFLIGMAYGRIDGRYILGCLDWFTPVIFGFHLFVNWRDYPAYRQVIQRTFVIGVLVMGAYGIFQFVVAPPWEKLYLDTISATSFGKPFPYEIRVFSTQDSPQGFGTVMMAGLLLLLGSQGNLRFPASGVGYLSFLLAQARSGWVGWVAGMVIFIPSLKPRLQMQLVLTIITMAILVVPLVSIEPFSEIIGQRFESLSDTQNDVSLQARSEGYQDLLALALTEFVGRGFGGAIGNGTIGSADSGILPVMFSMGWFGTIPYLGGMLLIFFQLFQSQASSSDPFSSAARAIALGTFAQVALNNIFAGSMGLVLWGFLGIGMAANKYHFYQRTIRPEQPL